MVDDSLIKSWLDVLDKVLVSDPLEIDDWQAGNAVQAEGDEPAIIEPAKPVLEAVIERPKNERAFDQAPPAQDPREQIGGCFGEERAVDIEKGDRGRFLVGGLEVHGDVLPATWRPI